MDIFYPLEWLADWLTTNIFFIAPGTFLYETVVFFVFDTIKIFILFILITHLMSLLRYYLPIEKLRDYLAAHKFYGLDYFLATVFGVMTPFCSCSSIPIFIGFLEVGIPLGVTFSFLITSPLVNEVAIALFIGLFGLKITLAYILAGIFIGMLGGFIIGKLGMEKYVAEFVRDIKASKAEKIKKEKLPFKKIFSIISKEAFSIVRQVSLYLIIGIGVGAVIHGYVPTGFFEKYLAKAGILAVPLAVILAVPMYSNATGVIPIIESLAAKGVPLGTALAFMMAIVGLSFPEAMILKKVLKLPLLLSFFGVVTLGIIFVGYLFNFLF